MLYLLENIFSFAGPAIIVPVLIFIISIIAMAMPIVIVIVIVVKAIKNKEKIGTATQDLTNNIKKAFKQKERHCAYCGSRAKENQEKCENCGSTTYIMK